MRFDDTLTTVLAQQTDDVGGAAAVWMQIVDILAQDKGTISPDLRARALLRVEELREKVPQPHRRSAAAAVAFQCQSAELVALFGRDVPQVAAPVLQAARLSVAEWEDILPGLSAPSRALLRERRDLPVQVNQMLAAFGPSDFALPAVVGSAREETVAQIQDLVARIEAFRKERADEGRPFPFALLDDDAPVSAFRFETGVDGIISWVDGAPRGPVIGIELGSMAEIGEHGVDGHAAGAFRRRTPFRNARMRVPGQGMAAGDWIISGLPMFDDATGRFEGYRCTARRPQREEHLLPRATGLVAQGLPPDSLRQLVHELRTPLNAIRGFAEMISAQLLGPVSSPYRSRAEAIIADARKLLAMFDDLDVAARIERGAFEGRSAAGVEPVSVLRAIVQDAAPPGSAYRSRLQVQADPDVPPVLLDLVTLERLFSRLITAALSASRSDDEIGVQLQRAGPFVQFRIDRPQSLAGLTALQLFDTSLDQSDDSADGPPLGMGFALRLVDSMATAVGAVFEVAADAFVLRLPVVSTNGVAGRSS
ncbi:sensor histidine kinase [Chakrabartia godavariana]|nr:sensor histidine kinase [Chakrabartia godavariana]